MIKLLQKSADEVGQPFVVVQKRGGIHVSTRAGGINLGPDKRSCINQRILGRYFKVLGLAPAVGRA